ncbi:DUF2960 domain-containing protein [Ferrimonas aestuarii]|uniref:DUF2960 domain-containing protein n=1 Tax=Ferrimonas aestuarii TaxID=2569539 RepID=A0A4U1BNI1_9GAMM|nr:DUF2960 domain-containing protein [Ferrimonas aestuarii]TKB53681.1 DUF2960 domain-containing protein [Ferrimonas aestuarii]
MALTISYTFKGKQKTIGYANDKFHDAFEAVAAAEGIDTSDYLAMEQAVKMSTRDKKTHRNFRDNYIKQKGFSNITVVRD